MAIQVFTPEEAWQLFLKSNNGEEFTLQYLRPGYPVYELYVHDNGYGIYCDQDFQAIFNLKPATDYHLGLNSAFIHLTRNGLDKVFADGEWVLQLEEE